MIQLIKKIFYRITNFFDKSLPVYKDKEISRQIRLLNLVLFSSFLLLLIAAISDIMSEEKTLAMVLFAVIFSIIGILALLRKPNKFKLIKIIATIEVILLNTYLVYSGAVDNFGPVWMVIWVILLIFIFGHKYGLYANAVMFTIFLFQMYYPKNLLIATEYSGAFRIRFVVLNFSILIFSYIMEYSRYKTHSEIIEKNRKLKKALNDVKELSGLIPICSSCKKIRDDNGYWTQVEEYVAENSKADFSHGICPDCIKKLYPEYEKKRISKLKIDKKD